MWNFEWAAADALLSVNRFQASYLVSAYAHTTPPLCTGVINYTSSTELDMEHFILMALCKQASRMGIILFSSGEGVLIQFNSSLSLLRAEHL